MSHQKGSDTGILHRKFPDGINTVDFLHMKEWLREQHYLPTSLPDDKLKMFMHSCYYDVESTKLCIKAYYEMRIKSPELFSRRDPEATEMKLASTKTYVGLLPGITPEGYKVLVIGNLHSDAKDYIFKENVKFALMGADTILPEIGLPPGIIVIVETSNFTFSHLRKADLTTLKNIVTYFQDALPVRLKKLIILNVPTPVNILLNMIHPFLNERMHNLIAKFPQGSVDHMNYVPKAMLPKEHGGDYKSVNDIQKETCERMKKKVEQLNEEDKLIEDLARRKPASPKQRSFFGVRY